MSNPTTISININNNNLQKVLLYSPRVIIYTIILLATLTKHPVIFYIYVITGKLITVISKATKIVC